MFVRDWMSAPAVAIPPEIPATAALGFMEKRRIRRLPVVEEGRLVGIVTKSDLHAALGRGNGSPRGAGKTVSDLMARRPVTVEPDETLERAAQIMLQKKVSGLPVVDGGRLAGILTESDIFRALCGMMGIGEPGARVVMTVRDGEDLLGMIRKRLDGLSMQSLVTLRDSRRNAWDVVLRVRGRSPSSKG